ncbi:hypothetical protein B0H67DRAFT_549392 [Lasiosphaeris hirsuta]|uniref:NTF2-like protein n=1 Tax=Lasiosphaeris hirsuta TaxID=260670 RepID=A0AA40BCD7_9PEZI|nr:hypothetical protein B0H67DRAFT_549392 [Lasiosphaeris hirsuta]
MALQTAYKRFLASPNSAALTPNATLHYITTTTSFAGATEIIKHLATLRSQVKRKKEDALFVIEGKNAVAFEVDTTLEFVTGGGAYLPGLDDNFVSDRTVYLPILHMVTFDSEGRITQIRQNWDQGSLLKQLDVIGKSGRNWPIRDSKDQISLIARCVKPAGGPPTSEESLTRARGNSNNVLRDPHASLALFAPREDVGNLPAAVVSPYAGTRPRQRSFTEILGDEPVEEESTSPSRGRERSQSPSKAIAPKIGAGKNYQPSRLFNTEEGDEIQNDVHENHQARSRYVQPNPGKYSHFDFADGTDPQDAPKAGVGFDKKPKTKHDTNWSFEDFVTPQKPTASRVLHKARDVRHWGNEGDKDVVDDEPQKKTGQVKGRRDAEAHFDFVDDGPEGERRNAGRPRGTAHNTGLGLYENNLHTEDGTVPTPGPLPLTNVTNLGGRHKDFDPHFTITDEASSGNGAQPDNAKVGDDRKKAVRMLESNWSSYDVSPVSQKENSKPNPNKAGDDRGIVIAGDGMGGKKGTSRGWIFGGENDDGTPHAVPGKQQKGPSAKTDNFWEY